MLFTLWVVKLIKVLSMGLYHTAAYSTYRLVLNDAGTHMDRNGNTNSLRRVAGKTDLRQTHS